MEISKIYYTSLDKMKQHYDCHEKSSAFCAQTLLEYNQWKKCTRTKLRKLTGLNKMKRCDLRARILEMEMLPGESFTREKWVIQTEEDVWMPFYLLKPKKALAEKSPVIIATHGHGSGGKLSTAGVWDLFEVNNISQQQNYTYGIEMARKGFYVFCPDARGFGERREQKKQGDTPECYMGCSCRELSHMAIGLGLTVTGLWVWDLMRLVDYIKTRPDCNGEKIGCMGLSGGGLQSLWLAALDDRIMFATVSGYFYGYRDSLLEMNQNCCCNYVPELWTHVDMGDIGALIAPRVLVIESGTQDHLNGRRGIINVLEQVDVTRKAYRLFHKENLLIHDIFEGKHRWNGLKAYQAAENCLLSPAEE